MWTDIKRRSAGGGIPKDASVPELLPAASAVETDASAGLQHSY